MKKNKGIFVVAALLLSFLCFPSDQVLAASNAADVTLTIRQSFEVENSEKDLDLTGTYELCTLDENTPMPDSSQESRYSFSLNGEQAETTISLKYARAGVYSYQLAQTTKEKEQYQYDRSCYNITVYVENGKEGQLVPKVIVEKGDGEKYGELEFQNSYQGESRKPSKPDNADQPVKTGDTENITLYVLIAAGALLLIVVLMIMKRYKQEKQ